MDKMDFETELKFSSDGDGVGTITGYASVFNLLDQGGDIVLPGAFKGTLSQIKKKKSVVPMLWQHFASEPIGIWEEISEDDRGLKVKGSLIMEVPSAVSARALIKGGAVRGLSIGYRTRDADIDRATGVRKLKRLDLFEVSLVTFPMLPEATVSGVKTSNSFDPSYWEKAFRDEGLSNREAKLATSVSRKLYLRDEGIREPTHRDGAVDVLMALRKLNLR